MCRFSWRCDAFAKRGLIICPEIVQLPLIVIQHAPRAADLRNKRVKRFLADDDARARPRIKHLTEQQRHPRETRAPVDRGGGKDMGQT